MSVIALSDLTAAISARRTAILASQGFNPSNAPQTAYGRAHAAAARSVRDELGMPTMGPEQHAALMSAQRLQVERGERIVARAKQIEAGGVPWDHAHAIAVQETRIAERDHSLRLAAPKNPRR